MSTAISGRKIGSQFRCLMRANLLLLGDIAEELSRGCDVVMEQTFYKAKRRIAYIDEIRKIPDVVIEAYVMCPSDERWKTNTQKKNLEGGFGWYKNREEEIEFPNIPEGNDRIYEVMDGEVRLCMDVPRPEILGVGKFPVLLTAVRGGRSQRILGAGQHRMAADRWGLVLFSDDLRRRKRENVCRKADA